MDPIQAERVVAPAWHEALLAPRSVALYGASDQRGKTSARPLQFLEAAGWQGEIFPINAGRKTVLGRPAWRSLSDLPVVPEHVFVLTGADGALNAVREAVDLGAPVVTVMSDGFAEAGPAGVARQAELSRLIAGTGTRVLGPSSLGVIHTGSGLTLTANAAFAEPDLPRGDVFVASQSGSLMGALLTRGRAVGVGFAGFVSMGSEVDLSLGEVCEATLDDPEVGSYALFLESLRHVQSLRRFAEAAAERGKPVVAYKLGRSQAAAQLSVSHTGALSGDDVVATAVLHAAGIARVGNFEALLEAQSLAKHVRRRPRRAGEDRPRIGVVSTTGGGGAMLVDQLEVRGLKAQAPSARTREHLAEVGFPTGDSPLIDLTLAGASYQAMRRVLEVVLRAEEFDAVVAVAGSSARYHAELTVQPIIDCERTETPLAAFVVPDAPQALQMLHSADVPAFRTPESCADALGAVLGRRAGVAAADGSTSAAAAPDRVLDEAQGYRVLSALGVPVVDHRVVPVRDAAGDPPFPGPMVVKALSARLPHKSDAGGVRMGVAAGELDAAVHGVSEAVHDRAGLRLEHCLVAPMVSGLAEVLVGYRVDRDAGPVVILASGGVLAELYEDRSVRCAPVDREEALAMIGEVRALRAVSGYRGGEVGDLDALADAIVAVSRASDSATPIWEAEVNPLMVLPRGEGVLALDALVILGTRQS